MVLIGIPMGRGCRSCTGSCLLTRSAPGGRRLPGGHRQDHPVRAGRRCPDCGARRPAVREVDSPAACADEANPVAEQFLSREQSQERRLPGSRSRSHDPAARAAHARGQLGGSAGRARQRGKRRARLAGHPVARAAAGDARQLLQPSAAARGFDREAILPLHERVPRPHGCGADGRRRGGGASAASCATAASRRRWWQLRRTGRCRSCRWPGCSPP